MKFTRLALAALALSALPVAWAAPPSGCGSATRTITVGAVGGNVQARAASGSHMVYQTATQCVWLSTSALNNSGGWTLKTNHPHSSDIEARWHGGGTAIYQATGGTTLKLVYRDGDGQYPATISVN